MPGELSLRIVKRGFKKVMRHVDGMKIKQVPEDFIVEEQLTPAISEGPYTLFTLTKKNTSTLDAVQELASFWRVSPNNIGYAGLKDKHAVTTQHCSVKGVSADRINKTTLHNITVKTIGTSTRPISLGTHTANTFTIVVRDILEVPDRKTTFLNTFGDQRFSTHNAAIGKAIVQADYQTAIKHVLDTNTPAKLDVSEHLLHHPSDALGALKHLPLKLLRIYVHAYQSHLWNHLAKTLNNPPDELPIVGFGSSPNDPFVKTQLATEHITPRQFILKSFPELSEEGMPRKTYINVPDLHYGKLEPDELNPGKKKLTITFTLPPGSYATEVVAQLFKNA